MTTLHAIIATEALAVITMAVVIYQLWSEFTRVQRDLLNRLMARNLPEYEHSVQATGVITPKPLRRRSMTDAMEAELEARRKLEREASKHA